MNGRNGLQRGRAGFTLLEVIVTLIVAAILGSMLVSFLGTGMTGSVQPLIRLQDGFTVNKIMENMTADYKKQTAESSSPLTDFKTRVQNGNVSTNTPYFGAYTLLDNAYITFDSNGDEAPGGDKVLKVSIAVGEQRLTALFTK